MIQRPEMFCVQIKQLNSDEWHKIPCVENIYTMRDSIVLKGRFAPSQLGWYSVIQSTGCSLVAALSVMVEGLGDTATHTLYVESFDIQIPQDSLGTYEIEFRKLPT